MKRKIIASVCVAALAVAKSGVLKGRTGSTYHQNGGIRRKQLQEFGVNVLDQHMVVDDNIITSASLAAALDVAFCLLEILSSKENLSKIKEGMGFIKSV